MHLGENMKLWVYKWPSILCLLISSSVSYGSSTEQDVQSDLKNSIMEFGQGAVEAYRNSGKKASPVKSKTPNDNGYFLTTVKEQGRGF